MIEKLQYKKKEILLDVENEFEKHRFSTWLSKEPETISWIEELFKKGDVFYDIGANIGVYSLLAKALYQDGLKIYSFEPVYHNFAKLCRNVIANNFKKDFYVYPIAVNEHTQLEAIELASTVSGSAMHAMQGSVENRYNFKSSFSQGVVSISLDDLVLRFGLPMPNHLKIDTDGLEEKILKGGKKILKSGGVRSVLVEISPKDISGKNIAKIMKDNGFISNHRINTQENHSNIRRKKAGNYFKNVIFTK